VRSNPHNLNKGHECAFAHWAVAAKRMHGHSSEGLQPQHNHKIAICSCTVHIVCCPVEHNPSSHRLLMDNNVIG
jgi:hypothetical protein